MSLTLVSNVLWFDVGYKRYTTPQRCFYALKELWFDVGYKRYTTDEKITLTDAGCGLM